MLGFKTFYLTFSDIRRRQILS